MKKYNRINKADRNRARRIKENQDKIFMFKEKNESKKLDVEFLQHILRKIGESEVVIKKLFPHKKHKKT